MDLHVKYEWKSYFRGDSGGWERGELDGMKGVHYRLDGLCGILPSKRLQVLDCTHQVCESLQATEEAAWARVCGNWFF